MRTAIRLAFMMSCRWLVCEVAEHTKALHGRNDTLFLRDRIVGTVESSDCLPNLHLAIDRPHGNNHRNM